MSLVLGLISSLAHAQTAEDAIMMGKKQWCNGITYMHSGWNEYWEGTTKRSNQNLGTVTTQSLMVMSNYGISDKLNVMASVPYIWTNASAGTLHGLEGFQDIALNVKYEFYTTRLGKGNLTLIGVGGFSTPLTNYENDFLPMSIGLGSTNLSGRLTADYQQGIFFTTFSSAYVWRSDVTIDRNAYYTDQINYTNQVAMPNQLIQQPEYRYPDKSNLVAEAVLMNMYTFGGFDIRKNDMPFVSNQMNMTSIGAHVKYFLPFVTNLEVIGGADFVIAGRNVGQSQTYTAGLYYVLSFKK